jgi:hypothetical protein
VLHLAAQRVLAKALLDLVVGGLAAPADAADALCRGLLVAKSGETDARHIEVIDRAVALARARGPELASAVIAQVSKFDGVKSASAPRSSAIDRYLSNLDVPNDGRAVCETLKTWLRKPLPPKWTVTESGTYMYRPREEVCVRQDNHPDDAMMRRLVKFAPQLDGVLNALGNQTMLEDEMKRAKLYVNGVTEQWSGPHQHNGIDFWMNVENPEVAQYDPRPEAQRMLEPLEVALVELSARKTEERVLAQKKVTHDRPKKEAKTTSGHLKRVHSLQFETEASRSAEWGEYAEYISVKKLPPLKVKKAAVLPFAPPDPLKNLLGPMVAPREAIRLHALGARRGYTGAAAIIAAEHMPLPVKPYKVAPRPEQVQEIAPAEPKKKGWR